MNLNLYKNGTNLRAIAYSNNNSASTYACLNGTTIVNMIAGDYIDVRTNQNTGSSLNLYADAKYNHIAIEKI